jgi:hypothetical protein
MNFFKVGKNGNQLWEKMHPFQSSRALFNVDWMDGKNFSTTFDNGHPSIYASISYRQDVDVGGNKAPKFHRTLFEQVFVFEAEAPSVLLLEEILCQESFG